MAEVRSWVVGGALIRHGDGLVMVANRRRDGSIDWTPPGGVIDAGEALLEGLAREVREETGLEVEVGRLVGVYSKPQKSEVVLTFEARLRGGAPAPSDEADLHQWFAPDALPAENFLPKHRERVEDAVRRQQQAVVKDQREPPVWAEQKGGM